ncbi:KTSC domain-containing protein [Agromyces fucosus]|uniref:KTSC domain-containing protein n=1 Tax=Agromyces fucosus TaxID=41985 RepID=A0A4Q2JQW6_9MICO|nr:KTSC domain-containing protein [Agromyces fucosus]RXZ48650.1 KTSC domain-containing protein [Agromyces fucosus]
MQRIGVSSSNIVTIGYDTASQTMEIEFIGGSVYQYFDIPAHIYEGLLAAGSAGQFFHAQVRGHYRYARV